MKIDNVKTLFFDYDGTLHDSLHIYKPAFLRTYDWLVDQGYKEPKTWHDDEIKLFLGQNPKEMWESFGKDIPKEIRLEASTMIGSMMGDLIKNNKAKLYPHALDTLKTLKARGYTLVFISNCRTSYMQAHTTLFNLDHYFTNMVNAEMYNYIPKTDILKSIMPMYEKEMAIIGDRHHDMNAGKENNIATIGCTYGFGSPNELADATMKINKIETLLTIFK